jgi:ADP-ribose pyrophosphatase YjhB (NUDIX family)
MISVLSAKKMIYTEYNNKESNMSERAVPFVSNELYGQVVESFPLVCVDAIPFDASTNKIGVITRATGKESGKRALIGGRIGKGETISQAIGRHLLTDLGLTAFSFHPENTEQRPFYVMQYAHNTEPTDNFQAFDPSKQSIGLTYIITIGETPVPTAEAAAFDWLSEPEIPDTTAYNQGLAMRAAFDFTR